MTATTAPAPSSTKRLHTENIFWITFVHVVSIAAIPTFTWDAFKVCLLLLFTISPIGVTLTYHRLLTHRAFKVPKWLEYTLATIGALSAQGPVMLWVAEHRLHHRYSDTPKDPHNSREGFFWAHVGHLFYHKEFEDNAEQWMKYVPDMSNQKYYRFLNKYNMLIALSILPVLYWIGGWSYVLWGGVVRVTLMLHITWFVNSASHYWGYKNFEISDNSRNCWWVAILAAGEGWHNNHHAQQACAAHGRRWFEFDLTYLMIRLLETAGLAYDVRKPGPIPPKGKKVQENIEAEETWNNLTPEPALAVK
jgi:stearoyl-CoA desaturase (delta-9 desaturase)